MKLLAAVGLALAAFSAAAAGATTPELCGSGGCTRTPTATLVGILTLPGALDPAEAPAAQPYFVFDVTNLEGRSSRVVYVPGASPVVLRFPGAAGWRRVPADDARLLRDAAATLVPYPAPTSGTLRALFAAERPDRSATPWAALAAIVGSAALAFAAAERRRRRRRH